MRLQSEGKEYHVWADPRGFNQDSSEVSNIPSDCYSMLIVDSVRFGGTAGKEYSNRLLAVTELGELVVRESWTDEAKFRCVE